MALKLSVILPTYNEVGNIGELIKAIYHQFPRKNYHLEIVVVDDNSPDGTAIAVKTLSRRYPVKLLVRTKKKGLATAILAGILVARGKIIVLMDTDFNHRPKDVAKLLKPILKKQADVVIGSRYIPGGGMLQPESSPWQYWFSRWGNYFVNRFLLRLPVSESLSGFLVIKRSVLNKLPLKSIFQGYGEYCIRLLYFSHKLGFKVKEVPVVYGLRKYGVSKSSIKRMIYFYLKTALELRFTSSKLRV